MYALVLESKAESDVEGLDTTIRARIFAKLQYLRENCDEPRHIALKGRHRGKFRLKIGTYRVLYTLQCA